MGRPIKNDIIFIMLVTYDISDKTWSMTESEVHEVIYFGFSDGKKKEVIFDNLSFGILVSHNDKIIIKETLPIDGTKYISTSENYMTSWTVEPISPKEQYECFFWVENAGDKSEYFTTFTYFPKKIFDSWIWDDDLNSWVPPVPSPNIGQPMHWDEETLSWIFPTNE